MFYNMNAYFCNKTTVFEDQLTFFVHKSFLMADGENGIPKNKYMKDEHCFAKFKRSPFRISKHKIQVVDVCSLV